MPASGGWPLTTFHAVWYRPRATRYEPGRFGRVARARTSVSVELRCSAASNCATCSSMGRRPACMAERPSELEGGAGGEAGDGDAAGGGGDGHHPGHQAHARVVEDRVVDGVATGRRDRAEVVDHVPGVQPRGADREQQGAAGTFGDGERVTGMEQFAVDQEAGADDQWESPGGQGVG